jgi:hypothetical protein
MLLPTLIAAFGNLDCSNIVTDGKIWDFSKIGGPRSVMESHETPPTLVNTTYTIDICRYLKRSGDVKKGEKCPGGTRGKLRLHNLRHNRLQTFITQTYKANSCPNLVCGIQHTIKSLEGADELEDYITEVRPIAGELRDFGGGNLEAKYTRLKDSELEQDAGKEGLRIELNGGIYAKRKQKAVVEFLCDPDRTGTETDLDPEDKYEGGEENIIKGNPSLTIIGFEHEVPGTEVDILRLKWRTKYACENQKDKDDGAKSGHWGFFTWFLIM